MRILDNGCPALEMRDKDGAARTALMLTVDGSPSLSFYGGDGKPRAGVGARKKRGQATFSCSSSFLVVFLAGAALIEGRGGPLRRVALLELQVVLCVPLLLSSGRIAVTPMDDPLE